MNNKVYKNLLKIVICLFWVSAIGQVFSQENWAPTSTGANVPSGRFEHTAVWTGIATNKMIVWGGYNSSATNTGGIYDPSADSWTATSTGANCPLARSLHSAVWTGSKMIIWGGLTRSPVTIHNTGGIYDPVTDSWTATSTTNAPTARFQQSAVWTGAKMIVWGGSDGSNYFNTGGLYDPVTDTWTAMTITNAPTGRVNQTVVWTGSKMIVWGGSNTGGCNNTGGLYDPLTDTWTTITTTNAPLARTYHRAVWTGSKMIVWGGGNTGAYYNSGGIYDPVTDTWQATSTAGAPTARYNHSAVWTGTNMIIWGGYATGISQANGGIYNPVTDTWTATTLTNAPDTRNNHTAVMTTNSMIVWGGMNNSNTFSTGGIYTNPQVIGIIQISTGIPKGYSLSQNYPNPFNPNSKIKFQIAKSGDAKLVVFDVLGREVSTIVNENLNPGTYEVDFDGSKLASGVYFYKLITGGFIETKKMILTK